MRIQSYTHSLTEDYMGDWSPATPTGLNTSSDYQPDGLVAWPYEVRAPPSLRPTASSPGPTRCVFRVWLWGGPAMPTPIPSRVLRTSIAHTCAIDL